MLYDYLVIGSGLFGAVCAFEIKNSGKTCLVIDKRKNRGGNLFCDKKENIFIHSYGPHIFHTSNKDIWDYVNKFVTFNRFINCPLANYKGSLYNLPFNMNTFHQMWGVTTPTEAKKIIEDQKKMYNILSPKNLEEQAIQLVGKDIYNILIKEYTEKQWGRSCSELPAFIIKRLPIRFTFDNNYFNDLFQGIPTDSYNALFDQLLSNIEVKLSVDFFENREYWTSIAKKIIYTGSIDQFYDYQFGSLEYRTVKFETTTLDYDNYQGNAVINYTSHDQSYTRIIEHKHFDPDSPFFSEKVTLISKEYSTEWNQDAEPFYPINDEKNSRCYTKYKELAYKEKNILFGGRLADYRYYDMDDVIENALNLMKEEL